MEINNILLPIDNSSLGNANKSSNITKNNDFKKVLNEFLSEANETDYNDKMSNAKLMLGEADSTHESMIAAEKADISLRLTIQIRNKIIDAYNEVMRMQI